jgi:hypothetical protein
LEWSGLGRHEAAAGAFNHENDWDSGYELDWDNKVRAFSEAIKEYDKAFRLCPKDISWFFTWRERVDVLLQTIKKCNQVFRLGRENTIWLKLDGDTVLSFPEVIKEYNKMFRFIRRNKDISCKLDEVNQVMVFYEEFRTSNSVLRYSPGISVCFDDPFAKIIKAYADFSNFDYADLQLKKSHALTRLRDYDSALASYHETLKWYDNQRGWCFLINKNPLIKPNDINDMFDRRNANVWFHKGKVYTLLKDYDQAVESYNGALRLNSGFSEAWYNKGVILMKLGRNGEALEALKETVRLDRSHKSAWYDIGCALGSLGRHEEAVKAYDEARRLGYRKSVLSKPAITTNIINSPAAPSLALPSPNSAKETPIGEANNTIAEQSSNRTETDQQKQAAHVGLDSTFLLNREVLDLSDQHPLDNLSDVFARLAEAQCRVQTLRLCGRRFLKGEMISLCQALQLPRLVVKQSAPTAEQGVHGVQSAENTSLGVMTLDLSRVNLGKEDVKRLAEMLKVNRSLTTLILAGCKLDDDAVKELVDALKYSHTSLISIDLSSNPQIANKGAKRLISLIKNSSVRELKIQGDTRISHFWVTLMQQALDKTPMDGVEVADAVQNIRFTVLQEAEQTASSSKSIEENPEAAFNEELAKQRAVNIKQRTKIEEDIKQSAAKQPSTPELSEEIAEFKQELRVLRAYYDELALLCDAKKQRYRDQQEFRKAGKNIWVYYCMIVKRMEEIMIGSKGKASQFTGHGSSSGKFKVAALVTGLTTNLVSSIVNIPATVLEGIGFGFVRHTLEQLDEMRQHNLIKRISYLGNLSDCKKAVYYVARHLTQRFANECLLISEVSSPSFCKSVKEWAQKNILADQILSPLELFAEYAVQRMLDALLDAQIEKPEDIRQEVSQWLGDQLLAEVSKPLTETGTLINSMQLKGQSIIQQFYAWLKLNTIIIDGKERTIPEIYEQKARELLPRSLCLENVEPPPSPAPASMEVTNAASLTPAKVNPERPAASPFTQCLDGESRSCFILQPFKVANSCLSQLSGIIFFDDWRQAAN